MKIFKDFVRSLIFGKRATSEAYIKYLKSIGVKIGNRVRFFEPWETTIDEQTPWLLEIGDDVQILRGVTILNHGYDWIVLKNVYGDILGARKSVKIGNNVFIGINSTILGGVKVGNNVVIGANSVVTKEVPDNTVVAGNPARVLMTLDEYYRKRMIAQENEAKNLVQKYRSANNGNNPPENLLSEFFFLFSDKESELHPSYKKKMRLGKGEEITQQALSRNQKRYEDIEDFFNQV